MERQSTARWLERLPGPVLGAAAGCFLAGIFAHIFAFTNIIPNADGISRVYDAQRMTVSGRWFLDYVSAWNGYVQSPAVIGFFSLLFLSLAAALTVSMLRIRRVGIACLCGALMSVFPSVAYTFLYLFTASAYCFGILLAVLSVWLVSRYKYGFLFAAPVLACAVGTYQAYLAVAASLCLICLLLYALEGGRTAGEIFRRGLRYLAFLVLGLGLYALLLGIFLKVKSLTLLDYKGISALGGQGLGELLHAVASAYWNFLRYFFVPHSFANYTTPVAVLGNGVLALTALWAFVRLVRRGGCCKRPGAIALTLAVCVLLPLALNLTVLMGEAMPIMRYALVLSYVLALTLADRAADSAETAADYRSPGDETETTAGASIACPPETRHEPDVETVAACPVERMQMESPAADYHAPGDETETTAGASLACPPEARPEPDAETAAVRPRHGARRPDRLLGRAACAAAALLLIVSFQIDNLAYTVSAQAHRATESFATRLVERVESTPGYQNGMWVVIIGGFPSAVYHNNIEIFSLVDDYSDHSSSVIPMNKHVYYYLNDWLNVPWQDPGEKMLQAVSDSALFQSMPLYPDDGSIVIAGGMVIVKLAPQYTPKKAYEIAYENRR